MYHPTTRVLTLLELLQSHRSLTGAEIAQFLEVNIRTARRYIAILEDLGVPVTADRGRSGGYRLMPGYKLPPMMFSEDETLALIVGLLSVRRLGLTGHQFEVEGALSKLERVLPEQVRDRMRALEKTVVWDPAGESAGSPTADVILTLSVAAREHRRVSLRYQRSDGEENTRLFDPYGLVCRRGDWYTIGHCHLRQAHRLFRLERVLSVTRQDETFDRPAGFDVLTAVLNSLGTVPRQFPLEVMLDTTLEDARRHISVEVAALEEIEGGRVLLWGYTDNLDWMARLLARADCRLEIRQPPELREALRRHAARIALWAEDQSSASVS